MNKNMEAQKRKTLNLALQGGGAHGAFAWGILDKLLESKLFNIEGVSATSAGSMNAIVLAQGLMNGGEEGARELLHTFWHSMSEYGRKLNLTSTSYLDPFLEPYLKAPLSFHIFNSAIRMFSPYQFNPFNFHPISEVLTTILDIEKLKNESPIKLFICATNVQSGKIHIFKNDELSIDAVLASACLPQLFQAVEINNQYYWDGGYLGNPAIFPLIYDVTSPDILILHGVPIVRDDIPTTVAEVDSRIREISFNSTLMREMRAIAFISGLIEKKYLKKKYEKELRKINFHCIKADEYLKEFSHHTVYNPEWSFLTTLRDLGRKSAEEWINSSYDSVGKCTSVNFDEWL